MYFASETDSTRLRYHEFSDPTGIVFIRHEDIIHVAVFKYAIMHEMGNTLTIGSILNPLAGKLSEDTRKEGKGAKTGASHDWRSFICRNMIG